MSDYKLQPKTYNLVALIGPTASGKSELAVKLAKKFNGEIISADSRQIYKGMDLGTGKIPGKWKKIIYNPFARPSERVIGYFYKKIRHYCIDYVDPKKQYSSANFQRDAKKAIADILKRGKLPILCGGTAHWIDAVVYNQQLPDVKPDKKLRATLEKKSVEELFGQLQKLDPERAKTIDAKNPHRLIRALEIVLATGKPVPQILNPKSSILNPLWLGIKTDQAALYKKIDTRLKLRLKQGLLKEVKKLHSKGLSWKKQESFGLEYKFTSQFLQKKITYDEMVLQLSYAIKHYSKRQLTWWKPNKDIKWINANIVVATKASKKFLTS